MFNVEAFQYVSASALAVAGTEEVVQWPDLVLDRISAALSPGTLLGAAGQFADVAFDPVDIA